MPGITPPDPTPWNVREIGARAGDSPSETFQDGHSTARRIFLVNWINRFDALKWLVGWAETYVDLGVTKLSRLVPQVHPEQTEWIATMATMKGHGKPGGTRG